jgi:hypothetical protein
MADQPPFELSASDADRPPPVRDRFQCAFSGALTGPEPANELASSR